MRKFLLLSALFVSPVIYAQGKTVVAHHCEVFIDKIATLQFQTLGQTNRFVTVYLKTLPHRLDSAVQNVTFLGRQEFRTHSGFPTQKPFQATAQRFVGARNYFALNVPVTENRKAVDGPNIARTVGYFSVLTTKGTKYIVKLPTRNMLVLNRFSWNETLNFLRNTYRLPLPDQNDVGRLPKTAYWSAAHLSKSLNPDRCR